MPNKRKQGKKHAGAWLREEEYASLVRYAQSRSQSLSEALASLIESGLASKGVKTATKQESPKAKIHDEQKGYDTTIRRNPS